VSAAPERIAELFSSFGPVSVRRMFSGAGVFADGLMIALAVDEVIYLKADDSFIPLFEREGQQPFSYRTRDGRRTLTSYWRMPDRLYDEPDMLAEWARLAFAAARRVADGKGGRKTTNKPARTHRKVRRPSLPPERHRTPGRSRR